MLQCRFQIIMASPSLARQSHERRELNILVFLVMLLYPYDLSKHILGAYAYGRYNVVSKD